MTKFDEYLQSITEDSGTPAIATAAAQRPTTPATNQPSTYNQQTPSPQQAPSQAKPNNPTSSNQNKPVIAPNDPKVGQAAKALGVNPQDLYNALTSPNTTHAAG